MKKILAAGGLVRHWSRDEILMIFRNGKWDLPKGKIEANEEKEYAAIREVEEECGVLGLEIVRPLIETRHTYTEKDVFIEKITFWFEMSCSPNQTLVPQLEEGITEVRWLNYEETKEALKNSYSNIQSVVDSFKALAK